MNQQVQSRQYEYTATTLSRLAKQELSVVAAQMELSISEAGGWLIELGLEEWKCQQAAISEAAISSRRLETVSVGDLC
jgi:hypothetical protein